MNIIRIDKDIDWTGLAIMAQINPYNLAVGSMLLTLDISSQTGPSEVIARKKEAYKYDSWN